MPPSRITGVPIYIILNLMGTEDLCIGLWSKGNERNLFESSYATRLNRGMGLYFGL